MYLSVYLFFTISCEQALDFYSECSLGTVVSSLRYGENGMPVRKKSMRGKIMHSQFEGPEVRFFASDNNGAEDGKVWRWEIVRLDTENNCAVLMTYSGV